MAAAVGTRTEVADTRMEVAAGTHTAVDLTAEATSRAAASTADPAAAEGIIAVAAGTAAFRAGSAPRVEAAADPIEDPDLEDSDRFLPVLPGNPPVPDMDAAAGRVPIARPWDASIQETGIQEIGPGATQARDGETHRGLPLHSAPTGRQALSTASTIGPEEAARFRETFRAAG
jgi:hypothetical protein